MNNNNTSNRVHCCFITDDNYIVPTSTVVRSIVETRQKNTQLVLHILAADLSDESANLFSKMRCEGVEIDIKRVSAERLKLLDVKHSMGICMASPAALLKFSIAEIFSDLDRMLYLDGDMLVRGDLGALYRTDLGDSIIAAVRDLGACWWKHAYAQKVAAYINTGVMLMDLRKMRKMKYLSQMVEIIQKYDADLVAPDQDYLNVILKGKIGHFGSEWNAEPTEEFSKETKLVHFNLFNKPFWLKKSRLSVKVNKTVTAGLKNTSLKASDIEWMSANEEIATVR